MIELVMLGVEEIGLEEIYWLQRGSVAAIDEVEPVDFVRSMLDGGSHIYKITGDAGGIVVLSIGRHWNEIEISCLAGKGLLKHFDAVHEAILRVAAAMGGKSVCGFVKKAGLVKLYQERTKAQVLHYFKEDILK